VVALASAEWPIMGFHETLGKHLTAIQDRDFAALAGTLQGDEVTVVTSDGRLVYSVAAFLQMYRD
jgi:hypothetical protein